MTDTIDSLKKEVKELSDKIDVLGEVLSATINKVNSIADEKKPEIKNKDGIPVGTEISAEVDEGEIILTTERTGYRVAKVAGQEIVEGKKFKSLSAAAEAVSGISRKSGWIFWRDFTTGKTLKERYKG